MWGILQTPYATYRQLIKESPLQLLVIFGFVFTYFFFVSPIKLRSLHPFLLTLNTTRLSIVAFTSYFGISLLLYGLGKAFKGEGSLLSVFMAWGYSLIPTLIWFFATSLIYLILPPPRHFTLPGLAFSILFITFSASLLWWKGILYYLTLRFALKLDLPRIAGVSIIFFPIVILYSLFLYKFHVFKVPFL